MANKLFHKLYQILLNNHMGGRRSSQTYGDRIILLVFLWAVIKERPVSWACEPRNLPKDWPFFEVPDDSTVSRRMRSDSIGDLFEELIGHLNDSPASRFWYMIDAKPMPVSEYSKDPDARVGRGAGKMQKGYKLYTIIDDQHHVVALRICPMNGEEKTVAFRMLRDLPTTDSPRGYLLGDSVYDSNALYDWTWHQGFRLLAPRPKPGTGLGHCYQSPHRTRAIEILESPFDKFAEGIGKMRDDIERYFGHLTTFAQGLKPLPAWVRRLTRVTNWVQGKVIIRSLVRDQT